MSYFTLFLMRWQQDNTSFHAFLRYTEKDFKGMDSSVLKLMQGRMFQAKAVYDREI